MWKLSVPLLLCAVMALTAAAPAEGEHAVAKRSASKCPTEWNGDCYIFEAAQMTWTDAEKACLSLGGNLASVHNKAEHKFIQDVIRTKTGKATRAWIGGYDVSGTNGAWMWSDGRPMTFTAWAYGQPNNYGGGKQNCMAMNWTDKHLWDDDLCHVKFASVCKRTA